MTTQNIEKLALREAQALPGILRTLRHHVRLFIEATNTWGVVLDRGIETYQDLIHTSDAINMARDDRAMLQRDHQLGNPFLYILMTHLYGAIVQADNHITEEEYGLVYNDMLAIATHLLGAIEYLEHRDVYVPHP